MEDAADVGPEDFFERPLHRDAAEVQDRIHAFDQLVHGVFVGEVAEHDFFAIIGGRGEGGDVGQAQHLGIGAQAFTQDLAEATGSAGQQQAIERGAGCRSRRHGNPLHVLFLSLL